MSDSFERQWHFYIDDMIGFIQRIQSYTDGVQRDSFFSNALLYDAVLRNLELIGEAATHIPIEIRSSYPNIQWRMIIATRNKLIHAYLGIDEDIIWSILTDDLSELLVALQSLKRSLHK